MDDLPPEPRPSREEMEAHYVSAIGHYAGVVAQLESKLQEAKKMHQMYRQKLHAFHNPSKRKQK